MHAVQYVGHTCETSRYHGVRLYVPHICPTSWMVLRSPIQLCKMLHIGELPDPAFALREIVKLSKHVLTNSNRAVHWICKYNSRIWLKYWINPKATANRAKNFEICYTYMWDCAMRRLTRLMQLMLSRERTWIKYGLTAVMVNIDSVIGSHFTPSP